MIVGSDLCKMRTLQFNKTLDKIICDPPAQILKVGFASSDEKLLEHEYKIVRIADDPSLISNGTFMLLKKQNPEPLMTRLF